MNLSDLLNHKSQWLKGEGKYSNMVVSSRVRFARNLYKIPFAHRGDKEKSKIVLENIVNACRKLPELKDGIFLELNNIDGLDKQFLIERHLMSHEHALNPDSKGLIVSKDESISVMINEEDHLRMQVMNSGFSISEVWSVIDSLDNKLGAQLNFAFDSEWGYLTACPTNAGTGMRASVMLHLPILAMSKHIGRVLQAVTKIGLTVRGLYGEGTQASGNFFQISNQVSLGHTEKEMIDNISSVIKQIIDQEENLRQNFLRQNLPMIEDRIWRSVGTLKNAYIITSEETIELLSMVRLGVDLGIVKDVDRCTVNELFIMIQPAHLQKLEGKRLNHQERDVKRASLLRERLKAGK